MKTLIVTFSKIEFSEEKKRKERRRKRIETKTELETISEKRESRF